MASSAKTYTIQEYGGFVRGPHALPNHQPLPEREFDGLEAFILTNRSGTDTGLADLLSLAIRRGGLKTITARNYAGLLTLADGTVIEILPKIRTSKADDASTKRVFLEMLRTLRDVPFRDFNTASLRVDRLSLLEVFITMFVTEALTLVKQGLKSSYRPVEENERFFKGKLRVADDIRRNAATKERVFVAYDRLSVDRPENRLLKATLVYLRGQTHDRQNQLNIARLLAYFDSVSVSLDHRADFSRCLSDRSTSHYQKAISWCRVFLLGNSFTAYAGSEVAIALLFPMERVFESFVAAKLRRLSAGQIELRTQDSKYSLFDDPKRFKLRPDVVMVKAGKPVVVDTKWKLLSQTASNYGISQADMYQMYAYAKKYGAELVTLLYPLPDKPPFPGTLAFRSHDGVQVEVRFVNLADPDPGLTDLIQNSADSRESSRETALLPP
jgi:5-methylcytosine-specific restriction enzyme subunit McrC